jgi:hypothetical protein
VSRRPQIPELPGGPARAAACALLLALGACSLFGPSFSEYRGATLRTAEAEGAAALERMQQADAVRSWVERAGKPDYVRADSDRRLVIFYLKSDQVVRFERGLFSRAYRSAASAPIRSDDFQQFTNADRERLGRLRLGNTQQPAQPAQREGIVRKRVGGEDGALPQGGGRP